MGAIGRILDQLKRVQEGPAWHGPPLKELLSGVSAPKAAARPAGGAHSIWELVNHMAVWDAVAIERLRGENPQIAIGDVRDWPPVTDASEAAWQAAIAHLYAGHQRLRDAVAAFPEARLDAISPTGRYTFYAEIHGVVQHAVYHAGQIALLKK